jgi:hypothetical protein
VADFTSQLKELQDDFREIAARAAGVDACVVVRPGQICALGLGRSGPARYAIYRVWNYDDRPLPPLGEGEDFGPNELVFSELLTLTSRAGMLLVELLQAGRYKLEHMVGDTVPYQLFDAVQWWMVFLLHYPGTFGHCEARGPAGTACACLRIGQSETTLAWIDQYPGVCLAALAGLKADLAGSPASLPTPTTPAGTDNLPDEELPNEPDLRSVLAAVADDNALAIVAVAQDPERTVDERMRDIYIIDNRAVGWTSGKWAEVLRVTAAAVRQTGWWKHERKRLRG